MAEGQGEEKEIPVPINNDLDKKIADAFDVFDNVGNRRIDVRDVATIIRGLGCCPSAAELQEIVVAIETPEYPGTVHLVNFLPHVAQFITEHKYQPASPEQLLEAFRVLDADGRGYLTKEQISTFMTQDGEPFTQDELDEMLEMAIDPLTQTVPYEYYINQLMFEPVGEENNIYQLADRIEAEKPPPPPPPKTVSEVLREMQGKAAPAE